MDKNEIVENIDHQFDRQYDLSIKDGKEKLTEEEIRELKGRTVKLELFKLGTPLSGIDIKEYLDLTNRSWGNKAQKTGISLCKDGCGCMTKMTKDWKCIKCGVGK